MRATTKMHSMRQVYKYTNVQQLGRENEMEMGIKTKWFSPCFSQPFSPNSFVNMLMLLHCVGVCSWQFCIYSLVLFRIWLKSSHCGNRHAPDKKKKNKTSEPENPTRTPFVISFTWAPHKFLFLFFVCFLFIFCSFFFCDNGRKEITTV